MTVFPFLYRKAGQACAKSQREGEKRPNGKGNVPMDEGLLRKLKMVRLRDLGHVFLFLCALLPAAFLRRKRPHLWLVCEGEREAQDNGYWFFRYLRREQPQVDAVYAVADDAPARERVAELGETVDYGSFRHWILYLAAEVNISSQKSGKPNAAVCYLLEVVLGWLKNRRVFLQHGVTQADLPFLYEKKARLSLFCCAARPEYDFIRSRFGYPEEAVKLLGFCRFDSLHGLEAEKELVLIVPTWRMELHRGRDKNAFLNSEYYRRFQSLLNSRELDELLGRFGKRAVFVAHRNMEQFEDAFTSEGRNIRVLRWRDADISGLIRRAGTLITDYSSVFMDFAYMKKPLLYYQFDTERYHRTHLAAGYFDYGRDGFGPVCASEEALLRELETLFEADCTMAPAYAGRVDAFFTLNDTKNSERTYHAICDMIREKADP